MAPPPIQVFLTTIASQPALRQRQEYILRILQVKKIPFTSYDLASDEAAKRLWKRKAPAEKQQLPGLLVGDKFPGTFQDFEQAVEFGELDIFLRRNEEYAPFADDPTAPEQQPIGVPGVATPLQMTPERLRPHVLATPPRGAAKGTPINKRTDFDVSEELSGFGLQGVRVTEDELSALVQDLGIGGDDARDLVKGLSGEGSSSSKGKDGKGKSSEQAEKQTERPEGAASEDKKEEQANEAAKDKEPPQIAMDSEGVEGKIADTPEVLVSTSDAALVDKDSKGLADEEQKPTPEDSKPSN